MRRFLNSVLCTLIVTVYFSGNIQAQDKALIGIGEITSSTPGADPKSFQTMLETQLIKTNKFTVIERDRLVEILKEQGLSETGFTSGGSEFGNISGVDYLVYGTITKLGEERKKSVFAGMGGGSSNVEMAVDIRIVDTETGEIRLAETVESAMKSGKKISVLGISQSSSEGDPLADVQRVSARSVVGEIATTLYPAKIIAIQNNGSHIISYGDSIFQAGDLIRAFEIGEGFVDPDTGEVLGAEETELGMLEITEATSKFSKATLLTGDELAKGNVVKRVPDSEIEALKKAAKKEQKKKRKKL